MSVDHKIRKLPDHWRKLNLGSNVNVIPNWVNIDIYPFKGVDTVADLNKTWPWQDDSIHYIRAFDIVEHLYDPIHTMNEAWRVLGHGAVIEIWVPSTDGRGAFQDPTHVSFWNYNSFLYYSQKELSTFYPGRIKCDFDIVKFQTETNDLQVIWIWALCRAIKEPKIKPLVSDSWIKTLSSPDDGAGLSVGTIVMPVN